MQRKITIMMIDISNFNNGYYLLMIYGKVGKTQEFNTINE